MDELRSNLREILFCYSRARHHAGEIGLGRKDPDESSYTLNELNKIKHFLNS